MQEIEKNNSFVTYKGFVYEYLGFNKIDDRSVHLNLKPLWYDRSNDETIGLLGGLTKVNGVLKNTSQEIIDSL